MKKIQQWLLLLLLAIVATNMSAQTTADEDEALRQRINAAVMGVYNDHLAKNPDDYSTLHMRAGQYFNFGKPDSALIDINRAIELTPKKEKELLVDMLTLRASIYDLRGDYKLEIDDLTRAAELSPSSPAVVQMMANVGYKVGDYESAAKNYQSLLRRDPRNYNAMYGMARVEVKRNNFGDAIEWCDKAIELYPAKSTVYLNKASILEEMNQPTAAAQTYLIALASTDDNGAAIQHLFTLSDTHYKEVMDVLRKTTEEASRVGIFYRIRAAIAIKHLHYGQALTDLHSLINNELMQHDAVYSDAALCEYHLLNNDQALQYIDKAIALTPGEALYHCQRGDILFAMGNSADALAAYQRAVELDASCVDAHLGKANVMLGKNMNAQALGAVNEAITADASSAEARMMRAYINKYCLNQPDRARADLQMLINYGDDTMYSLKGFAMHELGDDAGARQWAQKIIDNGILPGGECYFYAAALLSYIGDNDKAMEYWASALANGFGSAFEAKINGDPYLNLAMLRSAPNFSILLDQNSHNFEEQ